MADSLANCPDCKSVVLFGEHYHRPGCNFGRELRATEFEDKRRLADHLHVYKKAQADLKRESDDAR